MNMASEHWYLRLPAGQIARKENPVDAINRELAELVARGWEPTSMVSLNPSASIYVMLKKVAP